MDLAYCQQLIQPMHPNYSALEALSHAERASRCVDFCAALQTALKRETTGLDYVDALYGDPRLQSLLQALGRAFASDLPLASDQDLCADLIANSECLVDEGTGHSAAMQTAEALGHCVQALAHLLAAHDLMATARTQTSKADWDEVYDIHMAWRHLGWAQAGFSSHP